MSHAEEQQPRQETSHFHFQMWDTHLNALNALWNIEMPAPVAPVTPAPTSFFRRLLLPIKAFIARAVQPSIDEVIRRQNVLKDAQQAFNAKVVQTLNGAVDLIDAELARLRQETGTHLQKFQTQLDSFQTQLDSFQTQFDSFQTQLTAFQGQFDSFQVQLTAFQEQFDLYQSQLTAFQGQFDSFQAQLTTFQAKISDFQTLLEAFQTHIDVFQKHANSLQKYFDDRLEQIEPRLIAFELMIWTFDRRKEAMEIEQILLNQKFEQLAAVMRLRQGEQPASAPALPSPERQEDFRYVVFENLHRGDEQDIKRRMSDYVPYFTGCSHVLDIGCARGEFLELLREHGINARGIDLNENMLAYCRKKGLQVESADAFAHLDALDDAALDGIFLAHLAEHFAPQDLYRLLQQCFRKLAHHRYLIVETPNPCSLYALSHHFYKDMTHRNPLHPETLEHLIKSAGFQEVTIEYKNPFPPQKALQELRLEQAQDAELRACGEQINQHVKQLNALLYGHLDYAIIAKKIMLF